MALELTAVYVEVPEGYIAFEARVNLREAVALVLEVNRELAKDALEGQHVIRERFVPSAA